MVFRYILIIVLSSILWCQSYFDRALDSNSLHGSARSIGMASLNIIDQSVFSSIYSPAKLAASKQGIHFEIYLDNRSTIERRSINVKDYFGDYLTSSDYVVNRNSYIDFNGGLSFGKGKNYFSISKIRLSSFNYNYIEEVHGKYSLDDGEIGNKDPISGFHNMKITGSVESLSLGYSRSTRFIDFGFGFHNVYSLPISESLYIDTLSTNNDNLAGAVTHDASYSTDMSMMVSLGVNIKIIDKINLLFSYRRSLFQSVSGQGAQFFFDDSGIVSHTYVNDNGVVNFIGNKILYIPPKVMSAGMEFAPKSINDIIIGIEYDLFSKSFTYFDSNINTTRVDKSKFRLGLGVEYNRDGTAFRSGLSYSSQYFTSLNPTSIFSIGLGKKFANINYDFGIQYQINTFMFPDMFPASNNIPLGYENINESSLLFTLGIKY